MISGQKETFFNKKFLDKNLILGSKTGILSRLINSHNDVGNIVYKTVVNDYIRYFKIFMIIIEQGESS